MEHDWSVKLVVPDLAVRLNCTLQDFSIWQKNLQVEIPCVNMVKVVLWLIKQGHQRWKIVRDGIVLLWVRVELVV